MSAPWLTIEDVLAFTGWTDRYVRLQAATGKLQWREGSERLRNGRIAKEYSLASLPEEARAKYIAAHEAPKVLDGAKESPSSAPTVEPSRLSLMAPAQLLPAAVDTPVTVPAVQTAPVRVALPPRAEQEALRRTAILRPLIEYMRNPASQPGVANAAELAAKLAAEHDISERTLWRWKARFDKDGSIALARKPRADKHRSSWAEANRDLADLAALLYIGNAEQPAQSKTIAWEQVCERARMMGVTAPSYETVRAFLDNPAEVSRSLVAFGRGGRKAYEAQFAPYLTRGYTEPAGSIWMSDHFIIDVLVQDNLFYRDLRHMRLQGTVIFDYRSRYVLAIVFSVHGSSHSIKRALMKAMLRHGLPDRFYCDNGKDYIKVARNASERDLRRAARRSFLAEAHELETGFLARVGVPVTFCLIYHGQSKNEERWHRTYHDRFDRSWPTYTAGETHLRPENTIAATIQHGKLLRMGRAQESSLPLASDYIAAAEAWIEGYYHQRPHSGRGMDGRSPAQVFEAERGVVRPCPTPEYLAMLLPERVTRKVNKCEIAIDNDLFTAAPGDQYGFMRLHELNGSRVQVAYDPLEPMFAAVLDSDGHYICRLERKALMRFSSDEETRSQVKGLIATRKGLEKAVSNSIADLNRRVTAAGNFTPLVETHMDRLELPRAVGDSIVHKPQRPVEDSGFKETHSGDIVARYFERRGAHGPIN